MRIAVISDIHGNFVSLKAALLDIKRRGANRIVCLGDVAAVGPQPTEVIEHLRSIRCPSVMGNTDEKLAKDIPDEFGAGIPEEERKKLEALDLWTRKELTKSHRHYLSTFKPTLEVHFGPDQSLLCYHGSPSSNRKGILPTMPDEELAHRLLGHKANVFAGGHTHTQMFRRFLSSLVINPGSIGLSFQIEPSGRIRNQSTAEYALVSSSDGAPSVELVSISYSLSELKRAVHNSDIPDPDWWLSDWH
jgi:predicted phosphodiesterase